MQQLLLLNLLLLNLLLLLLPHNRIAPVLQLMKVGLST
jgi:hypothetical protein